MGKGNQCRATPIQETSISNHFWRTDKSNVHHGLITPWALQLAGTILVAHAHYWRVPPINQGIPG
jgi:hypothetical protein